MLHFCYNTTGAIENVKFCVYSQVNKLLQQQQQQQQQRTTATAACGSILVN